MTLGNRGKLGDDPREQGQAGNRRPPGRRGARAQSGREQPARRRRAAHAPRGPRGDACARRRGKEGGRAARMRCVCLRASVCVRACVCVGLWVCGRVSVVRERAWPLWCVCVRARVRVCVSGAGSVSVVRERAWPLRMACK